MTLHALAIDALLAIAVLSCWIGVLGMIRMREPIQAMHYLSLPASFGIVAVTLAVFLKYGLSSAGFKTLLIAAILLAFNSVVTHATARAFRTRELGHWEPRDGDPIEFVKSSSPQKESPKESSRDSKEQHP